jgi:diguanylate cyclase (GGDEF)-like protein
VRSEDIATRFGGDEFTLILPGASREIVRERAEKLRKRFRNMPLDHGLLLGDAAETLSLSCGIAVFPDDGDSSDAVVKASDRALYEAKNAGKNCVMLAKNDTRATIQTQPLPV